MGNGGGPACLRLRVVADPATIDPRFLMSPAALDRIAGVVDAEWPETIAPREIGEAALIKRREHARRSLDAARDTLGLLDSYPSMLTRTDRYPSLDRRLLNPTDLLRTIASMFVLNTSFDTVPIL